MKQYDVDLKPMNFNMSITFLMRLDKYLEQKDMAAAEGNLLQWFRWLRVIWSNIIWKVREEGNDKRETKVKEKMASIELSFLKKSSNYFSTIEQALYEIDKEVNQLLYDYHLLYVDRENRRYEYKESLEKDYLGEF